MDWYVRDIILYGEGDLTRSVSLEPGVNIITGESKTGKSALIPIIDYCLGSADYEVPVGVIREFTRWYAIRLQTAEGQLFLARKEPGQRNTSNEMYLIIGLEIPLPAAKALTGNTDRDAVVKELSRRLGMMEQTLAESPFDKAYTDPPTIRNVVPFLFQPQNVIANKDTLFYKTDPERHQQHRQRLQRIFPFVLGAINAEYFQLKNDLDIALRELRKWERQLSEYHALAGDGISVARTLWDRSVALGLISREEPFPQDDSDGKNTGPLDVTTQVGLLELLE